MKLLKFAKKRKIKSNGNTLINGYVLIAISFKYKFSVLAITKTEEEVLAFFYCKVKKSGIDEFDRIVVVSDITSLNGTLLDNKIIFELDTIAAYKKKYSWIERIKIDKIENKAFNFCYIMKTLGLKENVTIVKKWIFITYYNRD